MLRELSFTIEGLATDYDSIEERYFNAFKEVHSNTNITIEEWRGSNIYNIFNTCILVEMVNNQFLSNFIPNIVDNSIEQNEIIEQKYSGNTTFYLRKGLKEVSGVNNSQIIDTNTDSTLPKSTLAIYIKGASIPDLEVAYKIYDRLNEGIVTQGDISKTVSRAGFSKKISYSIAKDTDIKLEITAQISQNWNGELYSNEEIKQMIMEKWNDYYDFQKLIQPLEFCKLDIFGGVKYKVSYNDKIYIDPFMVNNGDFLILSKEDITLNIIQ